ncbi:MAG: tRNA lysidine(34) synthetase TilS [Planctomycetota bacterium]|nr:tRNA lysidine(34) synthetase TilS [Planctomycetota bacterium]
MRLPIVAANAIRTRKLIAPGQRVLVALSGGPDSAALLHCLMELASKRDLRFSIAAAHLNHGLRGKRAAEDEEFCRKLCARRRIPLVRAFVDTPRLAATLKRSREETARIARHAFLAIAAAQTGADCVAVGHHADDRVETVIYRLCRGTGLAGLQGIGWTGPLRLDGEPDVRASLEWRSGGVKSPACRKDAGRAAGRAARTGAPVVRPLLACTRKEVLAYLQSKRQKFCTDESNFDVHIPRNAVRNLVLPLLEEKVHPGARAALWRLAEEAEMHAEKRALRRDWLAAFARIGEHGQLALPVPRLGAAPASDEIGDVLELLRSIWNLGDAGFSHRHVDALRHLFNPASGAKRLVLPGGLTAQRRHRAVVLRRELRGLGEQ